MTNLDKLREELSNSKVVLDKDYWDKQNKLIGEMQDRFVMEARNRIISYEKLHSPFNV